MTGKKSTDVNSVLPLNARSARIAACGGLAASAHDFPAGANEPPEKCRGAGRRPDRLDCIMPQPVELRAASSLSVPGLSDPLPPFSNENPT